MAASTGEVSDSASGSVASISLSVAVSPSVAVGVVSASVANSGEFRPELRVVGDGEHWGLLLFVRGVEG